MDELHFLNTKKIWGEKMLRQISDIATGTLKEARITLPSQPIDMVFINSPRYTIKEYGIGGMSEDTNLIYIYTDIDNEKFACRLEENLQRTIAHEYHHCCRRELVGYGDTLGEQIVSEGLADVFAYELFGGPISPWATALSANELRLWEAEALPLLSSTDFDYFEWFLGYGKIKPMWTGYALGWAIVNDYLSKNKSMSASKLVAVRADDILLEFKKNQSKNDILR